MENSQEYRGTGLRGIHVADTKISFIDGENGKLIYRGLDIEDLVGFSTFEEVAYLLIYGNMPTFSELESFKNSMKSIRALPEEIINHLQVIPKNAPPMIVLQSCVALLAGHDPEISDDSIEANYRKAVRVLARMPCILASWERIRNGLPPLEPDGDFSYADNFLYMLKGERAGADIVRSFDVALILHAEHSFNASTFTSRVVASTRSHLYAAVSAAIGSLSGELHGGANAEVMKNLLDIGDLDKVEAWVKNQFEQNKKIMGMGHAVYETMDPRAEILRQMAEKLGQATGDNRWYMMTERMVEVTQAEFKKRKGGQIYPNVDMYSASVYHMMGIPNDLFTPVFTISRTAGWVAHIIEEKFPEPPLKPVLYRPSATYTGNYCGPDSCEYTPIDKR